ncbi:HNH endonuclease [Kitasatospora sp. McL0602]|uniref:HNH endonuclease n=1 Tax=Kitasatospora sp. McL0602 TaxID=3439530 RepID=UPI003F8A8927
MCAPCVADEEHRRQEDRKRARQFAREKAGDRPCAGPDCAETIAADDDPRRAYCSDRCKDAADYQRRKARQNGGRTDTVRACRRCYRRELMEFPDGVCKACQDVQRTRARRVSVKRGVTAKYGDAECWHCSTPLDAASRVFEHLKPIARGGLSEVTNCRWSCRDCNSDKGHALPSEWTSPNDRLTAARTRAAHDTGPPGTSAERPTLHL